MKPPKSNAAYSKSYTLFSAMFLVALLCFGVVMLAERFGWSTLAFAGVLIGGIAILIGGAAVIAQATRNFRPPQ
jgi:multidrug transporter EmrE-like cation transporter